MQVGARPGATCSTSTDKEAQKRGDQFIASEMFLLALADDKGEIGALAAASTALTRKALEAAIEAVRGGQKVEAPKPKASARR